MKRGNFRINVYQCKENQNKTQEKQRGFKGSSEGMLKRLPMYLRFAFERLPPLLSLSVETREISSKGTRQLLGASDLSFPTPPSGKRQVKIVTHLPGQRSSII